VSDQPDLRAQLAATRDILALVAKALPIAMKDPETVEEADLDAAAMLAIGEDVLASLSKSKHLFPDGDAAVKLMADTLAEAKAELGWNTEETQ